MIITNRKLDQRWSTTLVSTSLTFARRQISGKYFMGAKFSEGQNSRWVSITVTRGLEDNKTLNRSKTAEQEKNSMKLFLRKNKT